MDNQDKKLKKLREDSSEIFNELFGFGKKKDNSNISYENNDIIIDTQLRLIIKKTKSTIEKPLPTAGKWSQLDWNNPEINWLEDAEFKAQSASVNNDLKIEQFRNCIWQSGDFRGGKFIGGEFNGGTFVGQFGPGAKWNVSPFNFIDGTTKENETILGLPNITNLNKDRFKFNIISVVPGNDIIINLSNGITHKISVIKRLDDKNSFFSYKVTNGVSKEEKVINVRWSQIRGQNATEFQNNVTFGTNIIPGVFTKFLMLPFEGAVKNVKIDSSTNFEQPQWSEKEETPADLSKKQVSYELSKLPLGIPSIPRKGEGKNTIGSVYFNFPSSVEQKGFNDVVKALEKNWLSAYIKKVKSALENGVVKQIPPQYPYLSNLLSSNNISESPIKKAEPLQPAAPIIDQDTHNAMLGIENFLKYFVGTMVRRFRKSGAEKGLYDVEDTVGRSAIKNKLKSLLLPTSSQPVKSKKVKKNTQPAAVNRLNIPESINLLESIKDILSKKM